MSVSIENIGFMKTHGAINSTVCALYLISIAKQQGLHVLLDVIRRIINKLTNF